MLAGPKGRGTVLARPKGRGTVLAGPKGHGTVLAGTNGTNGANGTNGTNGTNRPIIGVAGNSMCIKGPFSHFRVIFGRFGGWDAVENAPGGRALHPARVLDHGDFSGPDSGMFCDFGPRPVGPWDRVGPGRRAVGPCWPGP